MIRRGHEHARRVSDRRVADAALQATGMLCAAAVSLGSLALVCWVLVSGVVGFGA